MNEKNMEIIELVEDQLTYSLLERSGNKNKKIYLPLELSIGYLNVEDIFKRNELIKYLKTSDNYKKETIDLTNEKNKIKSINSNQKVRIWSSHFDCEDYCLLLFICNRYPDKNISVVFSDEYNEYATCCTQLDVNEIKKLELLEHNLTKDEINNYGNQWNKVLEENKELRFLKNSIVQSVDINYFDKLIIERLSKMGKVYIYKFIGDIFAKPLINNVYFSEYVYFYLINRLVDKNMIIKEKIDNNIYISI